MYGRLTGVLCLAAPKLTTHGGLNKEILFLKFGFMMLFMQMENPLTKNRQIS